LLEFYILIKEMSMKKYASVVFVGLLFILPGCESSKSEVAAREYNLIVHHVSSTACSSMVIGYVADEYGYSDVNFHQDSDSNVSCEDYGKTRGKDCETAELSSGDQGYGGYSCVLGTDKKPTKGDLAKIYTASVDLSSESEANK
jgi:hypothetical protein